MHILCCLYAGIIKRLKPVLELLLSLPKCCAVYECKASIRYDTIIITQRLIF